MSTMMNEDLILRDDIESNSAIDLIDHLRSILEEINAIRDDNVTRELLNYTILLDEDENESACKIIRDDLNRVREYDDEKIVELSYDAEDVLDLIDCGRLNEALPADLAKAFRTALKVSREKINQTGYGDINDEVSIDFENSDYKDISKYEAFKLIDEGRLGDLRIIFDDQLVVYGPNKRQTYKAIPNNWKSEDKYRHNGNKVTATNQMSIDEVITGADKIYLSTEAGIDSEQRAERRSNSDSRFISRRLCNLPNKNSYAYTDAKERYQDALLDYKRAIDAYHNYFDTHGIFSDSLESRVNIAKVRLDDASAKFALERGIQDDRAAKIRDYEATKDISANVRKFKELKSFLYNQKYRLQSAQDRLDRIKQQGSTMTRIDRDRLRRIEDELRRLNDEKTRIENSLEHADERDTKAAQEVEAEVNKFTDSINDANSKLDELLRRKTESLTEDNDNLSDAEIVYNKIVNAGKLDELDAFMKELYPEGLTDDQMNDILTYESDFILKHLDMEV